MRGSVWAALDAHVRQAWTRRRLSDGTVLNLGATETEQTFKITLMGTTYVPPKETGRRVCPDGSSGPYAKVDLAKLLPDAGGHTHPLGKYGDVSSLPGPEDGVMAVRTGKPAYIISGERALAVEHDGSMFRARVVAGKRFTNVERSVLTALNNVWRRNQGGSGMVCELVPD